MMHILQEVKMDFLLKTVSLVNSYLSDYVLTFLLVGAGVYFSIRTKFVQIRCFGEGVRNAFGISHCMGGVEKTVSVRFRLFRPQSLPRSVQGI